MASLCIVVQINWFICFKTNFFLHLVRNILIISTFLRQDLKISGVSFVPGKEDKLNKATLNWRWNSNIHIYWYRYVYLCMLCIYTHVYVYICICALLVITTMALSQLMYLGTTVHHVPKCMRCHKTIVAMTGRIHYFHDYIYITPILLWRDLSTLCVRVKRLETTLHK